jgi:predicted AlkP superfamily phosphohydrolase/phosphomutase
MKHLRQILCGWLKKNPMTDFPTNRKKMPFFLLFLFLLTAPALAYVGPGAGFAFLSSFLVLFLTFFLALFSFLSWPFRFFFRLIKGRKAYKKGLLDQVVILGLDGMDPVLAEKYMAEGKLPHLSELKERGSYSPLETTIPSISPVAWSSFMTGCHPAKHNIFDFLSRDPKTYLPDLSSARIGKPKRTLCLGKYRIPLSKPEILGLRRSIPFWKILGEKGIFCTILRIPITFPPEKFRGHLLSGMCAPDLKGSQGTFFFYTSDEEKIKKVEGGETILIKRKGDTIQTSISGPENTMLKKTEDLRLPMTITVSRDQKKASIEVSGQTIELKPNTFSDWIRITFRPGWGIKVHAICRFLITQMSPHFEMYLTPLNIDPEKPALPISHPFIYSVYLSKLLGRYTTLGEANDTWALNEKVLSEKSFLELSYANHREWEDMLFNALDKTKHGLVVSWFETTDSIQHMFYRYLDEKHPALHTDQAGLSAQVIEDLYTKMDDLVGKVLEKMKKKKSCLIIMSDHGIKSFRRGVNLNSWLLENGYLRLKGNKKESAEWFKDVDWTRSRAYGLGLGGMYINQKGREAQGTVNAGEETQTLKTEIAQKLSALRDNGQTAINKIYDCNELPPGPYHENGPDLVIGYNEGYRVSWDSVTGKANPIIFEDNTKAWSGDHCIDPKIVPGIFFSTHKFNTSSPSIVDIAPTVLDLFGIQIPVHMDGRSLLDRKNFQPNSQKSEQQ